MEGGRRNTGHSAVEIRALALMELEGVDTTHLHAPGGKKVAEAATSNISAVSCSSALKVPAMKVKNRSSDPSDDR